jgi:hypothetical protein
MTMMTDQFNRLVFTDAIESEIRLKIKEALDALDGTAIPLPSLFVMSLFVGVYAPMSIGRITELVGEAGQVPTEMMAAGVGESIAALLKLGFIAEAEDAPRCYEATLRGLAWVMSVTKRPPTMAAGAYRYRIKSTGESSKKFGVCEVCGKHVAEVHHQVEEQSFEVDGVLNWTSRDCLNLFGHEECLVASRRSPIVDVQKIS